MKMYQVELYQWYRHGQYGASYHGICIIHIEAKNKKEAKENALRELVGELASEYNFPIDYKHAPEFEVTEDNGWSYTCRQIADPKNHIINEYDIAIKNIVADVTVVA